VIIADVVSGLLVDRPLGGLIGVTVLAARASGLATRGRVAVAADVPLRICR